MTNEHSISRNYPNFPYTLTFSFENSYPFLSNQSVLKYKVYVYLSDFISKLSFESASMYYTSNSKHTFSTLFRNDFHLPKNETRRLGESENEFRFIICFVLIAALLRLIGMCGSEMLKTFLFKFSFSQKVNII